MKQNEKNRELSQAEKKRLDEFNNLCEELDKKGFTKNDQTFGIVGANVFSIVMLVIAAAAGILLFILNNGHFRFENLMKKLIENQQLSNIFCRSYSFNGSP